MTSLLKVVPSLLCFLLLAAIPKSAGAQEECCQCNQITTGEHSCLEDPNADDRGPGHPEPWMGDCGALHPTGCGDNRQEEALLAAIEAGDAVGIRNVLRSNGRFEFNGKRGAVQALSCDRTVYVSHIPLNRSELRIVKAALLLT